MNVRVRVYRSAESLAFERPMLDYIMDHDDPAQRRILGEQCRNAFEGGQLIVTNPV